MPTYQNNLCRLLAEIIFFVIGLLALERTT